MSFKLLILFFVGCSKGFLRPSYKQPAFNIFDNDQIQRYQSRLYMAQRQALAGESVVQSVNHYRKIHAHVDIPLSFVVPNDSTWPADLHGFRLGNVLRRVKYKGALPEYHQELENIGFIMSASDHKFDLFLRSLKRYKELNDGCTKVPAAFVVPENVLWPEEMWGLKLGKKVITTRARKSYQSTECTEKLNEIGFTWEPVSQAVTLFLGTLKNFKEVHGHLNVPKNYVVPHKSIIYPPEAWGMKIGFKVSNFIYRDNFHSYKEEFEKIGLLSGKVGTDTRHWEFIYMSMKTYRSIYGHLRIPPSFMVPEEEPWHKSTWGLKLGYRTHNIKYRGDFVNDNPHYRVLLEELGFRCDKIRKDDVLMPQML